MKKLISDIGKKNKRTKKEYVFKIRRFTFCFYLKQIKKYSKLILKHYLLFLKCFVS